MINFVSHPNQYSIIIFLSLVGTGISIVRSNVLLEKNYILSNYYGVCIDQYSTAVCQWTEPGQLEDLIIMLIFNMTLL